MAEEVQVKRGRGGRPAAGQGDVEARLLAAATRLFLERGYDATSCDQVALDARAGKASIYARYANKAALFAAVIDSMLARTAQDDVTAAQSLDARLAAVGMRVVEDALHADALGLLRLLVANPAIGMRADHAFWQAGVRRVAQALALRGPGTVDAAMAPAAQFIELVLAPALMRALLGEAATALMAGTPARIAAAIAVLTAGGKLDGWT